MFRELVETNRQEHLWNYFNKLDADGKIKLEEQLKAFDWSLLSILNEEQKTQRGEFKPIEVMNVAQIEENNACYRKIGVQAIAEGKVAAVLLAGGQGSRLGFDGPKGTFNVGKENNISIFSILLSNLLQVVRESGSWIHLYIMTSELNDIATKQFFKDNTYFGYNREYIHFYIQETVPAVDFEGKLLMGALDSLAYSPNGNGGWYSSLKKSGMMDDIYRNHIEWLNVFSVDNVLQKIVDPIFVGATINAKVTCGAKVIKKNDPYEKVGVLCYEDGKPSIVEYYDLSDDMANQKDKEGNLAYGYGVILNYLFSIDNLERMVEKKLPVHLAKKKVQYVLPSGDRIIPDKENGYKFEILVLDMIQYMDSCLPYEVLREKEFAPIKNMTGVDSLQSAQKLLEENGFVL